MIAVLFWLALGIGFAEEGNTTAAWAMYFLCFSCFFAGFDNKPRKIRRAR